MIIGEVQEWTLNFSFEGVNRAVTFSIQSFRVLFQGQERKIQTLLMLVCKDIICAQTYNV